MPRTALVIASNRAHSLDLFWREWLCKGDKSVFVVLVEDGPDASFPTDCLVHAGIEHYHYSWSDINYCKDNDCFSRRDSAIKSFGFMKAVVKHDAGVVICLDDDCYPLDKSFVRKHVAAVTESQAPRWVNSTQAPMRGIPYMDRGKIPPAAIHMGLWRGHPDHDSVQTLGAIRTFGSAMSDYCPVNRGIEVVHPRQIAPFSGMNFSFRNHALPLMYFPKMGDGSPYSRFDDIWCGVIFQKILAHLQLSFSIGEPHVSHVRASNPMANLVKEAPGIAANEIFWKTIDEIDLAGAATPLDCMRVVGEMLPEFARMPSGNALLDAYLVQLGGYILSWCNHLATTAAII